MNIEQVKEEAKKRFGKDITDEQAKAWLDTHPTGELRGEELENVAGGGSDICINLETDSENPEGEVDLQFV